MGMILVLMTCCCFTPSFGFSSHFDSDGALLSELSWPSSLAVVAVSFSGLITFIFLMLACLCCKKGDIGFKELDNVEGEDYTTEFSVQSSPAAQNGPEVYVLPLTEVSVPMSKQPGRSVQLLKSTDLGRQSLLYLKEIGHGWFGKVLLGEVNSGISSTQVVVKELKVSASVQEQMLFLEETHPYRVLQHDHLLQCLAQCAEITPYLLVMEFCSLGDLKGYLQSCAATESTAPDPLTLQRMGCEVCSGLLHLHKNNYTHSDLALRNCLLTADLTVKIGDYGLAHSKYRDDYLVTSDQLWVPLRWIAPELIDEVHGNLLVVDQTKTSNIWSLGVTLWELFELGRQPYEEYSDRQVLCYVIKEQQLKLPKPQLNQLLSDRWFEVMQFCWLQPDQRPTAEEVHLLLSYLSVKGASELEEEFEKRWNSMKPNGGAGSGGHHESELSSYPLLEHFSSDGFHSDGDDVLTVTQTSQGLNFEYKWERGRHEQYPLSPGCPPYQDMYYTPSTGDRLSLGVSPSCYENKECIPGSRPLEVVPVLSARSPSVAGDYYIRIEEPVNSSLPQHDISPNGGLSVKDNGSFGNSSSISLSMEPLLGQAMCSAVGDQEPASEHGEQNYEPFGEAGSQEKLHVDPLEAESCEAGAFIDPLGASPCLSQLCQARLDTVKLALVDRSEPEEKRQKECSSNLDSITVQNEEVSPHTDIQGELFGMTSRLTNFSPHWASNASSNNNISSAPQGHNADTWCNRRTEESQLADTEPYGPESWQNMESGDIENISPSLEETSDQLSNGEVTDFRQECSVWLDRQRDTEASPSTAEAGQIESSTFCAGHTDVSLLSPMNAVKDLNQGMDPLGATLLWLCEPRVLPEPTHSIDISEQGVSVPFPQGLCPNILSEGMNDLCISPSKESETPDKPSLTDSYHIQSDSDDEDTMEVTSGVFTDLSSERGDTVQSFRSLQKQVGTPDSLDSLDMPSTASSCEAFSLGSYAPCGQPKALDSGYDTENYESPEFVQKEPQDSRDTEPYYQLSQSQEHGLGPGEMSISRSVSSELQSLDAKNPYRDSAYFSDYESSAKDEDEEGKDQEVEEGHKECPGDPTSVNLELQPLDCHLAESFPYSKTELKSDVTVTESQCSLGTLSPLPPSPVPKDHSLLQPDSLVREDSVDEGLGMESLKESFLDKAPSPQSTVDSAPHSTFTLSPVQISLTKGCPVKQGASGIITLTTGLQEEKAISSHREAHGATHLSKCLSPPLPRKEGRIGESPTIEDDDEDEESDDSDESDEELRCYNIQEHSEESEEEHGAVPIIITENGSSGHLRSLLKLPNFDRKKKAVSFYDDVTVYLFDQESPTRELAEPDFPNTSPDNGPSAAQRAGEQSPHKETVDPHLLEESGTLQWDSDLPVTPVKTVFVTSLSPAMLSSEVHSLPVPVPLQKPAPSVQLSRFSVSPTPPSRFSITQVADSDVSSVQGSTNSGGRV
ncbi:serine/threonine-protein kinase LMTK1 isoform X2 [Pelobates fuscus]|uniref:serine/threonine-protein kinase LMTK1 isoform X2 n=1 Tax=Pelobates fuscus TaxID=191477 RepID=UPI002FE4F74F